MTLPAGADPTLFVPEQFAEKFPEGNYTAKLNIKGNDPNCYGLLNIPTERTMEFVVLKKVIDIPPEPFFFEIISPENKSYTTNKIPLIVDANRNPGFTYSLNGGPQTLLANPTTLNALQGSNTVTVFAGFENQTKKVTFFVDSIAPKVEIISPEAKTYTNGTILININAIDANLKHVWFTINDGPELTYTAPFFKTFSNGNFVLKAFAEDNLGNQGTDQVSFTVNVTQKPPQEPLTFSIISPENKSYTTDQIPLVIQSNRNAAFSYSLNGKAKVNFISPTTITATQGSNSLEVFAENQSKKVTFFVDSTKPQVSIISPEAKTYTNGTILISITAKDTNLKRIFFTINNGPEIPYITPFLKTFSNGNFILKAFAEDSLGNRGTDQVSFTVNSTQPQPPQEPLTFSIISPENKSYNINEIPLIIQANRDATFSYSLNGAQKVNFISPATLHAKQGSNTVEVFAENQSKQVTFFVDSIPPQVDIMSPEAKTYTNGTILINIIATDTNLKKVFFTINNGPQITYTEPFFKTFSNGSFTFKAFAEDSLGNQGNDQVAFAVNIPPKNDTKPPSGGGGGGRNAQTGLHATLQAGNTVSVNRKINSVKEAKSLK
jgi:hypothetical protein